MKRLITLLLAVSVLAGIGWGQSEDVTLANTLTFTIGPSDDATDSTFFIPMRDLGVIGQLLFEVKYDSIAGFPDGFDSTRIRYVHGREMYYKGGIFTIDSEFETLDTIFFSLDDVADTLIWDSDSDDLMTSLGDTLDNNTGITTATVSDFGSVGYYDRITIVFDEFPPTISDVDVNSACTVTPAYSTPRKAWTRSSEAYIESDGTSKEYSDLKLYEEGITFDYFDWDCVGADNHAQLGVIEMGGIPWTGGVILNVQHVDSNTTPTDSGNVYIKIYRPTN